MKRIVRIFSFLFVSMFFMALASSRSVSANYDDSKNYVSIRAAKGDGNKLELKISITYQRGFDKEGTKYTVCHVKGSGTIDDPSQCGSGENDAFRTVVIEANVSNSLGATSSYISPEDASIADKKPTTQEFTVTVSDITVDSTTKYNSYVVIVDTLFCAVRKPASQGGVYNDCQYWHNPSTVGKTRYTIKTFSIEDALNFNNTKIEDEGLKTVMEKISGVVYGTVMPIIYAILGLFLVVRGAILGIQIVKSADEPQVRQEKVGAIKWLVIGVAVAFLAAGLVSTVTGFFSGAFK